MARDCFADEVAIDFPHVGRAVARMRAAFLGDRRAAEDRGDLEGYRVDSAIRIYADSVEAFKQQHANRKPSPPPRPMAMRTAKKRTLATQGLNHL